MTKFAFELFAQDGSARLGRMMTLRGTIETPAFMPVGTAATVKAMLPDQVRATGAEIILSNTYHLMLRPGAERIRRLGGLHRFMNWAGPILTDSGGYQVMSLSKLRTIEEGGVTFRSHIDGAEYRLTPERAVEIQCLLGSDIQMQLDECTPFPATESSARASLELSARWALRSRKAFHALTEGGATGQALFGIVQGSTYAPLRRESLSRLEDIGFEGYSVGGLAVGEGQDVMFGVLDAIMPAMPKDRPRYLMGVGKPDDLVGAVARGIDMFDCVVPTRSGRHGQAFTSGGQINLKNAQYAEDEEPLDPGLACPASREYSRAYLHHLVKAGEMLGSILITWHNLAFYQALMAEMRAAIRNGTFDRFQREFAARYDARRDGADAPLTD